MDKFYVYVYIDPRDNTPFYVGKGSGRRWKMFTNRNRAVVNKIKKIESLGLSVIVEFPYTNVSEELAFQYEESLVKKYGRRDLNEGTLLNFSNGGEGGTSGTVWDDEYKRNMSKIMTGRVNTWGHKVSKAQRGTKRKPLSEEHKRKVSESLKGHPPHENGLKRNFIITSPNGEVYEVHGLREFCRKHKLNQGHLSVRGKHKGWICERR